MPRRARPSSGRSPAIPALRRRTTSSASPTHGSATRPARRSRWSSISGSCGRSTSRCIGCGRRPASRTTGGCAGATRPQRPPGRAGPAGTATGGNPLYRNNHDGTFADITERAGVGGGGWSTGCGFADYDRDGDLDLFVSRYVKLDLDNLPEFGKGKTCEHRGIKVQCGPRGLPGMTDLLYRNDGNGHFTEVSEAAGGSDPRWYFGLRVAWFDANQDGWPDLYVANDSTPSFFYVNQKNGTFKEVAFPMGVAGSEA